MKCVRERNTDSKTSRVVVNKSRVKLSKQPYLEEKPKAQSYVLLIMSTARLWPVNQEVLKVTYVFFDRSNQKFTVFKSKLNKTKLTALWGCAALATFTQRNASSLSLILCFRIS